MTISIAQLAKHEIRLAWRDLLWLMTAGRKRRAVRMLLGFGLFIAFLHAMSYVMITHSDMFHIGENIETFVAVTATISLSWMLMLSQAMESITRTFYTRGDLDLILSSPISPARIFALRIAANAALVSFMSVALIGPVVNVLAVTDDIRWLAGYGIALCMGLAATAIATLFTVALFHITGPKRTRLIAQIAAALVGAIFAIGIQAAAILSTGNLSPRLFLHSPALLAAAPPATSMLWLPARAIMGDMQALAWLLAGAFTLYFAVTWPLVGRFAHYTTVAAGVVHGKVRAQVNAHFTAMPTMRALRKKEWLLIWRDPWLVSQTMMQLLYLLPPALLLWRNFSETGSAVLVLVPVLVMAAGQLSGGVTWITICGEDAPDLMATLPMPQRKITIAKLQTVLRTVATVFGPLLLVLAIESPWPALVSLGGIIFAALCTATIQLWFRTRAKRNSFRRRQTASRIATFAEAFCCLACAGTAALIAAKSWFFIITLVFAFVVLATARSLRPAQNATW